MGGKYLQIIFLDIITTACALAAEGMVLGGGGGGASKFKCDLKRLIKW